MISVGSQYLGLQQVVDRKRNHQHESYGDTQSYGGFHVLRYSQVRAHTQEERKYHVVHEYGADK